MDLRHKRRPIAYLTRKAQISCCHRLNRQVAICLKVLTKNHFLESEKNRVSELIEEFVEDDSKHRIDLKNFNFSLLLSEEENKQIYGKCNNLFGHGHNYTVEVTVRGPVDSNTGMVMNLEDLKDCMEKVLMNQMDHKNIDVEVDYFRSIVSTTENVAIYIFEELKTYMSNPELLYEVKVHETDKNVMCFRGEYDENVSS